jgi:DNA replication protein DnaC
MTVQSPLAVLHTSAGTAAVHRAVEEGRRVRYFSATGLVVTLHRGLSDNSVSRVIEPIMKADIVLVDEIGFVSMDDTCVQLFFRVVAAAMKQVAAIAVGVAAIVVLVLLPNRELA